MLSVRRTDTAAGRVERTQPVQECVYSDVREGDSVPRRLPDEQSRDQRDRGGPENQRTSVADILLLPAIRPNVFRAPILAAVLAAPARPRALPNGDVGPRNGCLRRQAAGLLVARLASAHSSRRVRPNAPPNRTGARSSRGVHERLASRAPSAGGRGHSSLPPRQAKRCPPRELSTMRSSTVRPCRRGIHRPSRPQQQSRCVAETRDDPERRNHRPDGDGHDRGRQ